MIGFFDFQRNDKHGLCSCQISNQPHKIMLLIHYCFKRCLINLNIQFSKFALLPTFSFSLKQCWDIVNEMMKSVLSDSGATSLNICHIGSLSHVSYFKYMLFRTENTILTNGVRYLWGGPEFAQQLTRGD